MIRFGTRHSVSLLILFYSGTLQMLPVTHFSETLLEAVEDELKVGNIFLSLNRTQLLSHSIGPPS